MHKNDKSFKMILGAYGKESLCEQRNFSLVLCLLCVGKRQSKEACDFQRGTHVMAISLTISLDYLPQI